MNEDLAPPKNISKVYKESWRDEYLKWICASFACQNSFSKTRSGLRRFANAQGGVLYIGKRDAESFKIVVA